MIICPNCKEEIDDNSRFCDQCGQALHYCSRCGRVGLGRRCTNCGGMMTSAEEIQRQHNYTVSHTAFASSVSMGISQTTTGQTSHHTHSPGMHVAQAVMPKTQAKLLLSNESLGINIEGVNGAVIGRRQGPYIQHFQTNMYVSGVHAQLKFNMGSGWSITDKHSSNGTKLNGHPIQPDVEMSLKDGDIVTIANINLKVSLIV